MALALPLAILNEAGSNTSIARFTDGNVTPPKTLRTLGQSESQTAPYKMSCWVGCVEGSTATVCNYFTCGQYSTNARRCGCIIYSPAMGGTQTWYLCSDWNLYAYASGAGRCVCACMRILCNGFQRTSCLLQNSGVGTCCCTSRYGFGPIDNGDVITYVVCTFGVQPGGGAPIVARSQICTHISYNNVNGTVILGTPNCIASCTQAF